MCTKRKKISVLDNTKRFDVGKTKINDILENKHSIPMSWNEYDNQLSRKTSHLADTSQNDIFRPSSPQDSRSFIQYQLTCSAAFPPPRLDKVIITTYMVPTVIYAIPVWAYLAKTHKRSYSLSWTERCLRRVCKDHCLTSNQTVRNALGCPFSAHHNTCLLYTSRCV